MHTYRTYHEHEIIKKEKIEKKLFMFLRRPKDAFWRENYQFNLFKSYYEHALIES